MDDNSIVYTILKRILALIWSGAMPMSMPIFHVCLRLSWLILLHVELVSGQYDRVQRAVAALEN